jgi:hypothetical protein
MVGLSAPLEGAAAPTLYKGMAQAIKASARLAASTQFVFVAGYKRLCLIFFILSPTLSLKAPASTGKYASLIAPLVFPLAACGSDKARAMKAVLHLPDYFSFATATG